MLSARDLTKTDYYLNRNNNCNLKINIKIKYVYIITIFSKYDSCIFGFYGRSVLRITYGGKVLSELKMYEYVYVYMI